MTYQELIAALESVRLGSLTLLSLISVILLFLICLLVIKLVMTMVRKLLERSKADNAIKGFLAKAVNVVLWAIAIIIIADGLGIDTASLVAVVGVAGLALSLSLQGVLGNIFSGMTILAARPFSAGDFVDMDGVSGTIVNVGLFYTTLNTVDNKTIHVPNSQVTGSLITNCTEQDCRRVDLSFGVSYEARAEDVKAALIDAAMRDGRVLSKPAEPFAGILSYKDSTVEYALRAWVNSDDYWDAYFALNEAVAKAFREKSISMSYPHVNVHMDKL